jgi:hypothetical protein
MMQRLKNYGETIFALLCAEFAIFRNEYKDKLINITIIAITQILVTLHIMPYFGLKSDFTAFMVGSWLASAALFEGYSFIATLVSDLSSEKKITYELLLPIPSWLIFIKMVTSFALQSIASSIIILPIAKLFLGNQLALSQISPLSLIAMFFVNSFFIGSLCLALASAIHHMGQMETAWVRFLFPLWFLGGFQFSFHALRTIFPRASYFFLANPILYTNEGFRSALLSHPEFIAVSTCVPILLTFTVILGIFGIKKLKTRLDFV